MLTDTRSSARLLPALFALLALSGCATVAPVSQSPEAVSPLYAERLQRLTDAGGWRLEGRLAINDGKDGGSGRLQWEQRPGDSRMDFHGALGRGAWRLTADGSGAELVFADGTRYQAPNVGRLVDEQVGWKVPVDKLSWWVLGLAAPGPIESRQLAPDGTVSELSQAGWVVSYGGYLDVDGLLLPRKLTARQGERKVKLAVREWRLQPPVGRGRD